MPVPRLLRFGLFSAGVFVGAAVLSAAGGGFTATLTQQERLSAGLNALTPEQIAALDTLVADDLNHARQQKVSTLTGSLANRHPEERRRQAGLDQLTPEQRAALDALIAKAVASRPQPRERRRLGEDDVIVDKKRLEVHGGLSFTYGWASGGRNFRETSAWTSAYDPETGLGIAVGLGRSSGDVLSPCGWYDPYYGGYGYGYAPRGDYQTVEVTLDRQFGALAFGFTRSSGPAFQAPLVGNGLDRNGPNRPLRYR